MEEPMHLVGTSNLLFDSSCLTIAASAFLRSSTDEELADIVEAAANIVIETLRKDGYLTDQGVEIDRPDWLDKDVADSELDLPTIVCLDEFFVAHNSTSIVSTTSRPEILLSVVWNNRAVPFSALEPAFP